LRLKIFKKLTASLNSEFTGSYKKKCTLIKFHRQRYRFLFNLIITGNCCNWRRHHKYYSSQQTCRAIHCLHHNYRLKHDLHCQNTTMSEDRHWLYSTGYYYCIL